MQRHGQLAGAEVGAEVAADLADRVDDQLADLLRDLLELLVGELVRSAGALIESSSCALGARRLFSLSQASGMSGVDEVGDPGQVVCPGVRLARAPPGLAVRFRGQLASLYQGRMRSRR